jgi:hypothetical protein
MDSKQACTGIKAAANGDGDYTGRGGLLLVVLLGRAKTTQLRRRVMRKSRQSPLT